MRAVQLGVVSRGEGCANYNIFYARKEGRRVQYSWVWSRVVRAVPTITSLASTPGMIILSPDKQIMVTKLMH